MEGVLFSMMNSFALVFIPIFLQLDERSIVFRNGLANQSTMYVYVCVKYAIKVAQLLDTTQRKGFCFVGVTRRIPAFVAARATTEQS